MAVPIVFVASSSEALDVVDVIHKLLQRFLGGAAQVKAWPGQFQLSKTYIESLERLLERSDFAVLVVTPDDSTKSRGVKRRSPRDNVLFEVGLFFGRLGRERCFIIQRGDLDLKLPTDLLGIEPATFSKPSSRDPEAALDSACVRIGNAIRDAMTTLPSRPRLGDEGRAAQAAMRRFADRIRGKWWERIEERGKAPALSFFTIELDDVRSSVQLTGKAYGPDADGAHFVHLADWKSKFARLEGNIIVYVRECQRLDANTTAWLPGLAEVTFEDSSDVISQGGGKFWESDESHPDETVVKFVELRRNSDEEKALTMKNGSQAEKEDAVRKILGGW
jgi:Predicted nucleotide-binding protein containing TIR-like domain